MPNTRILIGYRTEHRNSEGIVLATATRDDTLKAAVDAAPAEFVRFELGVFHFQRKARRSPNSTPQKEGADSAQAVLPDASGGAVTPEALHSRISELVIQNGHLTQCAEELLGENERLNSLLQKRYEQSTLPATPARETVVAEGASSAAASEPAQPAAVVVGSGHVPAAAAADDAADGGEDDDETPLIPGGTPPRKKSGK